MIIIFIIVYRPDDKGKNSGLIPVRQLSLAPLTVPGLSPPEFISCAAQAEYSHVALRLIYGDPLAPEALLNSEAQLRETRARLRDDCIAVSEIEVLVLDEDICISDCTRLLDISAEIGARDLVVCVRDRDFSRVCDNFSELSRAAAAFELRVNLEFVPYTAIRTLDSAFEVISASGASNVGVLIDTIHFDRAGHRACDIARFPNCLFPYVQLCDAPVERPERVDEMVRQSREERLYPGEGGIDIPGILSALPPHLPVSIEVPNLAQIKQYGEVVHARKAREQVTALLQRLDAGW